MARKKQWWEEEKRPYNPLIARVDNMSYSRDYESLPIEVMEVERSAKTVDGLSIIVTIRRKKLNTPRSQLWYWGVDEVRLV